MPSFNQVILIGHLCADPEMKITPSQMEVCNFRIGVNNSRKDSNGNKRDEVLFIDCTAFGKTAETISQYFQKGKPILIVGRLRLEQWEDKNGGKRSKHTITVDRFTFVGGDGGSQEQQPPQQRQPYPRNRETVKAGASNEAPPMDDGAFKEDDIPF